jgi:hypothetical protein
MVMRCDFAAKYKMMPPRTTMQYQGCDLLRFKRGGCGGR